MSGSNVELVQGIYAAFGRGDIAAIIAALDPDIDWETIGPSAGYPVFGPRKGIGAVKEFFQQVAENEEFSEFAPQDFSQSGDKVIVLGRYTMKLKKTGKLVSCSWAHIFTVRNGKVTTFREHTDTAQFVAAYRQ
jgi:hypothetical protein